ncbi:sugar phosphate isomerase/epimerase [Eubacteriales bacterium OttesenSCG-928-G02]|nr:sugar phosphate isomerase/epimerase [Eubacteriales bacterium OttesenSCG-928-G02]
MKIGMITYPGVDGIKRIRNWGLDYAEFDVNDDNIDYVLNAKNEIKAALAENNVKISVVGRWGRNRINKDGSFNEKEQRDEFNLIDFCEETNCPVYICGVNYVEELSYYENITAAINYIKSLMDYAGDRVKISTYNCHWNSYIDEPKAWDIVHDHLKGLGIKYDPSHAINGGRDYMAEIVKYGHLVNHIHIKGTINVNGQRFDDPPAGLDMINWGAFLSVFRKHKYDGVLSIEPHSETWNGELGDNGIRYTIDYLKKLLFI